MVTAVGGSGVFSGPTGAQYQQAGVEGLSGALATQRAFAEQKRAQEWKELYDLAKANADTLQVPITSVMSDPGFQEVVRSKLGNSMGGFLGVGGQRRLDQFLSGLVQTYGGQAGEEYRSKGDVAAGRIVADQTPQVDRSMLPGYEQTAARIMAPPAPPVAGVTPPPAPPAAPAPTPAPAPASLEKNPPGFWQGTVPAADTLQPTSPITQAATTKVPPGSGTGVPDPEKVREWYRNTGLSLAAAFGNKDAAREKRIKDLTTAISQTEEELSVLRAAGDSTKLDMKLRFHQNNIAELDRLTNGEFSKQKSGSGPVPAQITPGLAAVKPAPEAAGQGAGVGAEASVDPQKLDTATLQNFWTKMYQEGKVSNPMAQVDTMRKLVADNPGSYQRLMGGSVQGATSPSGTETAPVGLEIPQKLGWSSDDIALFRKFYGQNIEDYQSLSGKEQAEYQRYVRLNTQLKNEFTKESRKEITRFRAAPGFEKNEAVQRSLGYLELTSPDNPILKDPRLAAFATDVTNQNIRQKEAAIRNELAQAGYTEAKIKTVVDDSEAALLMSQAEVLKARNEGVKAAYDGMDNVLSGLNDQFAKAMMEAKGNKAKEDEALAAYNNALANNPVLKTFWDSNVKLLAESNGMAIQMQNYMTQRAKFLRAGKEQEIPTASAFGTSGAGGDRTQAEADAFMQTQNP